MFMRLCGRFRLLNLRGTIGASRAAPVDTFQQHRQLRGGQTYGSRLCCRPHEAAILQPFGQQAPAVANPPEHLDPVASSPAEAEDMAAEDIGRASRSAGWCQLVRVTVAGESCKKKKKNKKI